MGRVTYESIKNPLPKRINIVLSNKLNHDTNVIYASSIKESLLIANSFNNYKEIMIIGGSEIYKQFLPISNKLYLTFINTNIIGDKYFPVLNYNEWNLIFNKNKKHDKNNKYSFSFNIFIKKNQI